MHKNNNIIVVKIGTAVLSKPRGGLCRNVINSLCAQVSKLVKTGYRVVIVSSGAIGAGLDTFNIKQRPSRLAKLQAAAAIGQSKLMKFYEDGLRKNALHAAQILLTQDDFRNRRRYINAKATLLELLAGFNAVPIINENDSIATDEIRFGDNDKLSVMVANLISARQLILLSNVDGLYSPDDGRIIPLVTHMTEKVLKMATKEAGKFSAGGMRSKLLAIKMAAHLGIPCVIANGKERNVILRLMDGEAIGTLFLPQQKRHTARKAWLAVSPMLRGSIFVDKD